MKILKLFLIFIFYFFSNSIVLANNKIFYIDVDYIFKNSDKGKEIILNLEQIKKNYHNELEEEKITLLKLEKNINKKKIF